MPDRLRVSLKSIPAMTMTRIALDHERLVYVICANRKLTYPNGRSPIVYIGTTRTGVARMATSAADRSWDVLWSRGVTSFEVRVITCPARQGLKSWIKLERAMLLAFREKFGEPPMCNIHGRRIREKNEFDLFARGRINQIIDDLTAQGEAPSQVTISDTLPRTG